MIGGEYFRHAPAKVVGAQPVICEIVAVSARVARRDFALPFEFGAKAVAHRHPQVIVDVFDHATVFNKNTPHVELAKELSKRDHNVLLVNYQPTSEMMVIDFAEKIKNRLPNNIKLHSLKLQETATSYAQWFASDND